MQSFLILGREKNKASSYITNFLKKENIDPLDISSEALEKAVGIEDVRNIQKKILLKPFKGKVKAVVIDAYENITLEAQNALLKILEEPPANTIIIISISKQELLLPTIISRCKIIYLKEETAELANEENVKFNEFLDILFLGKIGDKLKVAQDIAKDMQGVGKWLEKMSLFIREKLIKNYNDPKYLILLKQLQQTYTIINSTNVSKRVALENLFLSF